MPQRIDMPRGAGRRKTISVDEVDDIIGKIGKVVLNRVDDSQGFVVEILMPKSKRSYDLVGEIQFTPKKINGKTFYHVDLSTGHQKFSGFRLMPNVYHYLITQAGLALQAGTHQSAGGRAIWNSLAGMEGVSLYAVRGKNIVELEKGEDGELVGKDDEEYSPYSLPNTKIIAVKS